MNLQQFNYHLKDSEAPNDRWANAYVWAPQDPSIRDKELLKYPGSITVEVTVKLHNITQLQLIQLLSSVSENVARAVYGYEGTRLDEEQWFKLRAENSPDDSNGSGD